ncbi:MAG: choice-of-anchor Q domain-containing protein [Pseudomonadota bacterium]
MSNSNGGGIHHDGLGGVTILRSTISNNGTMNSNTNGGGIYNNSGVLVINYSTISGNAATNNGGGISNNAAGSATLSIITNSTISGNNAPHGAGIFSGETNTNFPTPFSALTLTHATITNNTAGDAAGDGGGGLYANGNVTLDRVIIGKNNGNGECQFNNVFGGVLVITGSNSLIDNTADNTNAGGSCAGANFTTDPLLGPLANNGGPTQTHMLMTGSPAIDPAGTAGACGGGINQDQRNQSRDDGNCDLGAFELKAADLNAAPTVASPIANITVDANAANQIIDLTPVFTDAEGDALTYSIVMPAMPLTVVTPSISGSNLTLDFGTMAGGPETVTIGASDGVNSVVTTSFTVTLTTPVNDPPTMVGALANITTGIGADNLTINLNDVFSDPDMDTLTYNVVIPVMPSTVVTPSINGSTLTLDFGTTIGGPDNVTISADDGTNPPLISSFTVTLTEPMQITTENAPILNDTQLGQIPADDFASLTTQEVVLIQVPTFAGLSCEQLDMIPPETLELLTPEQFNSIQSASLSCLDDAQVGMLDPMVLNEFMPDDVNALPDAIFMQAPSENTSKFLVNLDPDRVMPNDVMPLLPPGWSLDMQNGDLTPPAGARIVLPPLPPPSGAPANIRLPRNIPDASKSFGLGGRGDKSILDQLNALLSPLGLTAIQDGTGVFLISGMLGDDPLNLALTADADELTQALNDGGEGQQPGAIITEDNQLIITTANNRRIPCLPSPQSPFFLADAFATNDTVQIGEQGDVIIFNGDAPPLVVLFSPIIFDAPQGLAPGLHVLPSQRGPGQQTAIVVNANGSAQQIFPYIPNPNAFVQIALALGVTSVNIDQLTGTAVANVGGANVLLTPQSTQTLRALNPGETRDPSLSLISDSSLDYTVGDAGSELMTIINFSF